MGVKGCQANLGCIGARSNARSIYELASASMKRLKATAASLLCLLLTQPGCRSAQTPAMDSEIRRHAAWGAISFNEGVMTEAEKEYRTALKRAWLLDNPLEIGKAAENLALCMASREEWRHARDWLVEARLELGRAGESLSSTYLIEAQIARACGEVELAETFTQQALQKYCKELTEEDFPCLPCFCREKEPREPKLCIVKCRKERREAQANFEAQARIVQAELALDVGNLDQVRECLRIAAAWEASGQDEQIGPSMLHVLGRLALAENQPLQAGRYFDREADSLREAESYREITTAREAAATAYDLAGRAELSADRLYRAARMWFARGERGKALKQAQLAAEMSAFSGDSATPIRSALLVQWIAKESPAKRTTQPLSAPSQDPAPSPASEIPQDELPKQAEPLPGPAIAPTSDAA